MICRGKDLDPSILLGIGLCQGEASGSGCSDAYNGRGWTPDCGADEEEEREGRGLA